MEFVLETEETPFVGWRRECMIVTVGLDCMVLGVKIPRGKRLYFVCLYTVYWNEQFTLSVLCLCET